MPNEIWPLLQENFEQNKLGYTPQNRQLILRDNAFIAMLLVSAERKRSLTGGARYRWRKKKEGTKTAQVVGNYAGLLRGQVTVERNYLYVNELELVKRKPELLAKYGAQRGIRETFSIPVHLAVYKTNRAWDQLVPFSQLLLKYLETTAPTNPTLKLFPGIGPGNAWRITNKITGYPPHYFRAFGEKFYAVWLDRNPYVTAQRLKVDVDQTQAYTSFVDPSFQLPTEWIREALDYVQRLAP
jgi:hypothetical protein